MKQINQCEPEKLNIQGEHIQLIKEQNELLVKSAFVKLRQRPLLERGWQLFLLLLFVYFQRCFPQKSGTGRELATLGWRIFCFEGWCFALPASFANGMCKTRAG